MFVKRILSRSLPWSVCLSVCVNVPSDWIVKNKSEKFLSVQCREAGIK